MATQPPSNPGLSDASPEEVKLSRFLVIKVGGYYRGGSHPLVTGCPPVWAEGWGDTTAYGPFVEVGNLRFLWHPEGFWFCEIDADELPLSAEQMRHIGAAISSDEEQIQGIRDYAGYKNRVAELARIEQQRIESEAAEERLRQDMRDNPEKWRKIMEESRRQHDEMRKMGEE